jgi:hypothetical protein
MAHNRGVGWSLSEDMTTQNTVIRAWIEAQKQEILVMNLFFTRIEVSSMHQTKQQISVTLILK